MKADSSEDCYHSQEEAAALLDALVRGQGNEYIKITYAARFLAPKANCEPGDLLHEAFYRVLDSKRKWPTSVGVVPFVIEVMKSIASHWSKKSKLDLTSSCDEADTIMSLSPTAEKAIEDRERLKHVLEHLASDPEVHALACARANEATRAERHALFNGNVKKHDTADRRLRRKLLSLKE